MGLFRQASSATLVGEDLVLTIDALDHSVRTLAEGDTATPAILSAISRRTALANRLRRAIVRS